MLQREAADIGSGLGGVIWAASSHVLIPIFVVTLCLPLSLSLCGYVFSQRSGQAIVIVSDMTSSQRQVFVVYCGKGKYSEYGPQMALSRLVLTSEKHMHDQSDGFERWRRNRTARNCL